MAKSSRIPIIYPDAILTRFKRDSDTVSAAFLSNYADEISGNNGIGGFGSATIPVLRPALSPSVELSLTVVYIILYGLLFLIVYVQLWMIWYYRHKRFSYQTVFLFLCLIWSGLRTTLFSFYIHDCETANNLPLFLYWLLYCFPICLQFTTLCLLVLFFAQVVFKSRAKYEPSKFKRPLRVLVTLAIIMFIASNLTCALVIKYHNKYFKTIPFELLYIRVGINDSLFIIFGILLSFCIYKMAKMSSSNLVLEAKGTTMCQAVTACILILLLYTSRAVYNFISIDPAVKSKIPGFGYDWVNVSDQADIDNLSKSYAYVSFGIVLFVWEVLPTFIVVLFFRVKRAINTVALSDLSSQSHSSKVFFFDNPRRYDSDEDLARSDYHPGSPYDINNSINTIGSKGTPRATPRGTPHGTPHGSSRYAYGSIMSTNVLTSINRAGSVP